MDSDFNKVVGKTVAFKSIESFFYKEQSGIKNNTIRQFRGKDPREELLKYKMKFPNSTLFIEIWRLDEFCLLNDSYIFTRLVKDVSYYEGTYIITWED